jgi:diguanylate cyclase (GGDEF)-like protein
MSKIRIKGVVASLRLDWRSRLRALIYEPGRTMIIFPAATAVMVLSVLPDWHWPYRYLVILVGVAASAAALACLRVILFDRLPRWSIHLDMCAGILIVSVLAAIGPTGHVNFAQLYIWFALYASLYLRPSAAVIYIALEGVAYMVVLTVGPGVDRPVIAWFTTFGAAAVSATAVLGLVSVLNKASREDALTGLPNRRSWGERLNEELERARRNLTTFSIASIDVDNFKQVNDTKGHQAGDRLLRRLADGWRSKIRGSGDFLARLGGDEFGLLAPGANQMEMQNIVSRLNEISPDEVSCSIGVATWDGSETAAELFRRADDGMYQVKTEHRASSKLII